MPNTEHVYAQHRTYLHPTQNISTPNTKHIYTQHRTYLRPTQNISNTLLIHTVLSTQITAQRQWITKLYSEINVKCRTCLSLRSCDTPDCRTCLSLRSCDTPDCRTCLSLRSCDTPDCRTCLSLRSCDTPDCSVSTQRREHTHFPANAHANINSLFKLLETH